MKSVSIIVPAKNEDRRIVNTLNNYSSILERNNIIYEIIVVANACTDKTAEVVKEYATNNRNVKLLESKTPGKGKAVINGFKCSKNEYVGFIDADDAFNVRDVLNMLSYLETYDGVIASKWIGRKFSQVPEPALKKVLARGWNLLIRILLNLKFYDTQAGAKFFRREVISKIDKNFLCDGFEFDVELLLKVKKAGFKVKEVYVPIKRTGKSTFKFRYILKMFNKLIKLWRLSKR